MTGEGVNPGAGYYFHDVVKVTNQGDGTAFVQATTSATTGRVDTCLKTSAGLMTRACYAATSPASATQLAVGATAYVGFHANATGVAAGSTVGGSLRVFACRTAALGCGAA